jgi:hypothetical protein
MLGIKRKVTGYCLHALLNTICLADPKSISCPDLEIAIETQVRTENIMRKRVVESVFEFRPIIFMSQTKKTITMMRIPKNRPEIDIFKTCEPRLPTILHSLYGR